MRDRVVTVVTSLVLLPDPENMGITFGMSLPTCYNAEVLHYLMLTCVMSAIFDLRLTPKWQNRTVVTPVLPCYWQPKYGFSLGIDIFHISWDMNTSGIQRPPSWIHHYRLHRLAQMGIEVINVLTILRVTSFWIPNEQYASDRWLHAVSRVSCVINKILPNNLENWSIQIVMLECTS